jgi:hypothetical protein
MLAIQTWLDKARSAKDMKPLRARPWFARLDAVAASANPAWAFFELSEAREDIKADDGFKAARADVWRRAAFDQASFARAAGIQWDVA